MVVETEQRRALAAYFRAEPAARLAFLFGSAATGRTTDESDIDVAVLLDRPSEGNRIWRELTTLLGKEVDLVPLNDAPATLVAKIVRHGIPLGTRDRRAHTRLLLESTLEAEDYAEFARDYRRIALRSRSLAPEDEARLLERVQFLDQELQDTDQFRGIELAVYHADRARRRNVERWAENILNALIDIAKVLLASQHQPMPRTYRGALLAFGLLAGLSRDDAERLADLARLRNLLAHEYLDILHGQITDFIACFPSLHAKIAPFIEACTATGVADPEQQDD